MGCIAEDGCRDAAAARPGEQACIGVSFGRGDPPLDQLAYLDDQRDVSRALALGGLVDEATRTWCRLPPDVPDPVAGIDVSYAAAGYFSNPGAGYASEQYDVAPNTVLPRGALHERVGEAYERG